MIEHPDPALRLGIFYDGGWFSGLWRFLADHSTWQAAPSFQGVHDALRWYLHRHHGHPLSAVTLNCAHYVLGRPTDPAQRSAGHAWDKVLARNGMVRHDAVHADGGEQDADDLFQQVALAQASEHALDVVALITGDRHMQPAVKQLRRDGHTVIVPSLLPRIQYIEDGHERWIRTSPALIDDAAHAPHWFKLLSEALDPTYPLSFPFVAPVPGAVSRRAADGFRYGTVSRWEPDESHGFVIDRAGTSWFVNRAGLPDNSPLPLGQPVRFTGNTTPQRGKKYPQVVRFEPYEPHGPIGAGRGC